MPATPFNRPTPLIGDATSSVDRGLRPDGWAFGDDAKTHLRNIIDARRDIRRYRPDPVPAELIRDIIEAGHHGPSVGHSQPWRFIVVHEASTREAAAVMADRERLRQAQLLTPDRRKRLLDLQLEGIREAPVGLIVACDRRTPASGVLGRNTYTDADLWSCAAAIQNMWLTARAHGLGMGWVTLFQPDELARLLRLPEGVETLGWLCLGWPDERPPAPGLERRGWSKRLPLDDVILDERWPDSDSPAAPVNALRVAAPEQRRVVGAHDDADRLLTPPGSLGLLDQTLDRVVAAAGPDVDTGTLIVVGADHPVTKHGISAFDVSVTADVMRASVEGTALGAATATACGLSSITVDAGVADGPIPGAIHVRQHGPRGDIVETDALPRSAAEALVEAGVKLGATAHGLVCLGEIGIGNTTLASTLAAALTGMSVADAVGLGASSDAAMVERKQSVVARALARVADRNLDPIGIVAALGGPEFAVLLGVTLGAANSGKVVVLDGLATSVAALAAVRVTPGAQGWLVASHVSRERAHAQVLAELGLEPLLDLRLRAGEGVGACYGAQALLTGLSVRRTAARWG
ncbi:5,6-dimethylbenzimidazole synthase [Tessaracoccus sp. OH4464_COT-324]|uniref:5,6-dimethylbenzimidazole synthase n=1 Tax=Tessaracoccus sp. OH4464_COT-324 TaxID=2491059 RepID=UPI000F631D17|nr:5,6-dimethylbenzimidazole synthase [Tessaracoccus sp. OH4464_COT-324]RRD47345.1 5,6-dimethylbenzimidazole synthase [Tessaracoccus sp. OH4464_COT-324]